MNRMKAQNRQKAFNKLMVQAYRRALVEEQKEKATQSHCNGEVAQVKTH